MSPPAVMLVDDEASARQTLEALLLPERYELQLASSGDEALERLADTLVDLVICDAMMPRVTGFDVCVAMKRHASWRRIPVIMLTALDGREDVVRALDAGADDFLSKPVEGTILRARARAMLRIRAQYTQPPAPEETESLLALRREQVTSAARLTAREREVLDLVLLGRSHQEIALALQIGERTSKFHLANLLRKLGAESRNDLMRLFL